MDDIEEVVPTPYFETPSGADVGRRQLNTKLVANVVDLIAAGDLLAGKVPASEVIVIAEARWLMSLMRDPATCDRLIDAVRDVQPGPLQQVLAAIRATVDTTNG